MILYSILVYILPFAQAPIPVCIDGSSIDSCTILVTMYYTVVMLGYDWWLCMVINKVYILLTQGYYSTSGEPV